MSGRWTPRQRLPSWICTAAMSEESTTVEAGYALQCLRLLICTAAMSEESITVVPSTPSTPLLTSSHYTVTYYLAQWLI